LAVGIADFIGGALENSEIESGSAVVEKEFLAVGGLRDEDGLGVEDRVEIDLAWALLSVGEEGEADS